MSVYRTAAPRDGEQLILAGSKLGLLSRACAAAEDGHPVTRDGWPPGRKIWVAHAPKDLGMDYFPPDTPFPTYVVEEADGSRRLGWTPERGDMAATDWRYA